MSIAAPIYDISEFRERARLKLQELGIKEAGKCKTCGNILFASPRETLPCNECERQKELAEVRRKLFVIHNAEHACDPKYRGWTWEKFNVTGKNRDIYTLGKSFADNYPKVKNQIFIGNQGTGKSVLASIIGQQIARAGYNVKYISFHKFYFEYEECRSGRNNHMTAAEYLSLYYKASLVVFDEVGRQTGTRAESNVFFDLFNGLLSHGKRIIFVSNLRLTPGTSGRLPTDLFFTDFVDADRIMDRTEFDIVPFKAESHRRNPEAYKTEDGPKGF